METQFLDDNQKLTSIDKSNMIDFCENAANHYKQAAKLSEKITVNYPKPDNIIIAGMGGSGIGGDLLKDWARNQISVPIEVNRDYQLPNYADNKTLVFIMSYSGDTEESLGAFLDALKRKCMIYCISSGGALLQCAEKLGVPYLRVPGGMPPRVALPYLFVPLVICMEKLGLVSGVSEELKEALTFIEKVSRENASGVPAGDNFSKTLALGIGMLVPVVYGFGFYRSVAMRFKQQFNENSKIAAKWEVFSELNHNEIVGWENMGEQNKGFFAIFIRDKEEPLEIKGRIETTKQIMNQAGLQVFEVQVQGKSPLAKMLSTVILGDFASVYLAVLHGVDPTPVKTINQLKDMLKENGVKDKIIAELVALG